MDGDGETRRCKRQERVKQDGEDRKKEGITRIETDGRQTDGQDRRGKRGSPDHAQKERTDRPKAD